MSRDKKAAKAERELKDVMDALKKNRPKAPGGGGGDGGGPGGGGGGRDVPQNIPPADDTVGAAQPLEITEALEHFLKARGMSLHEFRTTVHTFMHGNQSVANTHLWEYWVGLDTECSLAYQLESVADLFMLAQDAKLGVPSMPKIMREFTALQKSDLEAIAHSDFLTMHTQFVEQFSGTMHSIIRNVTSGAAARSGLMSAVFDKTNSKHSLFNKGETNPSISRRLKFAVGQEPGVGTDGVYDSESHIYIDILKEHTISYIFTATAKSSPTREHDYSAPQATEHARSD